MRKLKEVFARRKHKRHGNLHVDDLPAHSSPNPHPSEPTTGDPSSTGRFCLKCAAIDFRTFFSADGAEIDLGPPSSWTPEDCDVCDFFSRCRRSWKTTSPDSTDSWWLYNKTFANTEPFLGIIRHALPSASMEDGCSYIKVHHDQTLHWLAHAPHAVEPNDYSKSTIDWTMVGCWLQHDLREGATQATAGSVCPGTVTVRESTINLVVIDCSNRRLTVLPEAAPYVTLSYVWGASSTTFSDEWNSDSELPSLPQTLEHSLTVCRQLGFRYLWIDRYCIPQGPTADRHKQIQDMDIIYSNSTLTLVSCAGEAPTYGLPGVCKFRDIATLLMQGLGCLQRMPSIKDILTSVWASRAWTYQESLLSKRRLYFTDDQLYFEGSNIVTCEWTNLYREDFAATDLDWIYAQSAWLSEPSDIYECIETYTKRDLTFDTDALNAFYGILTKYQQKFQVHHLWGMPYLDTDLAASKQPNMAHSLFFDTDRESLRRTDFPSWSWAGWTHSSDWDDVSCGGWLMGFRIAVELKSGPIVSLDKHLASHEFNKQNNEILSHFIHVQGFLLPVRDAKVMALGVSMLEVVIELMDGISLSYLALNYRKAVLKQVKGQSVAKYALWRPASLVPQKEEVQSWLIPHLLIRNVGEHWERVANVSYLAEYKNRDGNKIEQESWPGDLQTIRLG